MATSNDLFDAALSELNTRRNRAKALASARRDELYGHIPRLRAIEAELAGTGAQLVRSVVSGQGTDAVARVREHNLALQSERTALLASLGLPEHYLEPVYTCPLCKDSGYMGRKMCTCLEKLLREEKLRRLNSASSLALSSFSGFRLDYYPDSADRGASPRKRMEEILSICRQYAAQFDPAGGKNLLMLGATGLGKTHLSLSIAAEVIAQGCEAVYGSVQDLFRKAETERFSREHESGTMDTLLNCELLILDDLGSEFVTGFTSATLYNIINTRLNRRKPTIISTNLSFKELNALYADRVVSRLVGSYTVLQFLGSDIRIALSGAR